MVVNEVQDGKFKTLFIGNVEVPRGQPRWRSEPIDRPVYPRPATGRAGRGRRVEQIIVNGVVLAANYALIALGLTLIFSSHGLL